jgi:hypothetical protein
MAMRQDSAFSRFRCVFPGQRQKEGAASERVHDGEERNENQEQIFCRFLHVFGNFFPQVKSRATASL